MVQVFLMHGFVGVGKTTFAKQLALEKGAIRFSPDEWVVSLLGSTPEPELLRNVHMALEEQFLALTQQLVKVGLPVILDFGFWQKARRQEVVQRLQAMGAEPILYTLTCTENTLRERVLKRSAQTGEFMIDEAAIALFKTRFEPLGEDEPHILISTG